MAAVTALPTIDLTPLREGSAADKRAVARAVDDACTEIGFFLVAGHGVPQRLITETRQAAIDFFALPQDEKMKCSGLRQRSAAATTGLATGHCPIRSARP